MWRWWFWVGVSCGWLSGCEFWRVCGFSLVGVYVWRFVVWVGGVLCFFGWKREQFCWLVCFMLWGSRVFSVACCVWCFLCELDCWWLCCCVPPTPPCCEVVVVFVWWCVGVFFLLSCVYGVWLVRFLSCGLRLMFVVFLGCWVGGCRILGCLGMAFFLCCLWLLVVVVVWWVWVF